MGENGSLVKRTLSNRDIQLGIIFLILALTLAFTATLSESRKTTPGKATVEKSDWREVGRSHTEIDSKIIFNYTSENSSGSATIWFEDGYPYENNSNRIDIERKNEIKDSIILRPGDNITIDLVNLEGPPKTVNFKITSGELRYEHKIEYHAKPYGLLSFPALLFLLLGMVFAFRGKGVLATEIKRKRIEEKKKSKKDSKKDSKVSEYKEETEETEEENVIYPGPGKEKRQEGDHVDFMGISETSKEEEEDNE